MKRELELGGLRMVFIGGLIQLVGALLTGRAVTAVMGGSAFSLIAVAVIVCVGLLLTFAGLTQVQTESFYFKKAKKHQLVLAAVTLVTAIAGAAMASRGMDQVSLAGMERSSLLELTIAALVVAVVWILTMLGTVRSVLRGCGHVAEQTNDPLYAIKCMRNWRLWYMAFLLTVLAVLASLAIMVTVLKNTIAGSAAGEDLSEALRVNISSSALLGSIIVLAVLVFLLIAHILYLLTIRRTYTEYHLEEVATGDAPGTGRVDEAQAADYAEIQDASEYRLPEEDRTDTEPEGRRAGTEPEEYRTDTKPEEYRADTEPEENYADIEPEENRADTDADVSAGRNE